MLQVVKGTGVPIKYMYHRSKEIQADPEGISLSFHVGGKYPALLFYPFLYVVGDSFNLSGGVSLANYEEISGCIFQAAQVEFYNLPAFYILNAVNDQFV